ncbi:MAG: HK97 family phage prohead protease [Alphaproteobacteria bacterium]|nr:HK97 family phage prohead protease [Alphaproteobacteria bacterium]
MTYKKISASMRERKRMAFALQVKSMGADGRFAGYASVFDIVDNQKDIIMKGAFAGALKNGPGAIKLLWQHQQDEPIGIFDHIFEDAFGLYVEGRLLLDVQQAREAHALLKAGAVSGLSIGYSPVRYRIDGDTGVRYLAAVDLFEISLVTFPANDAAKVTVVKGTPSPLNGGGTEMIALQDALDKAILTLRF